jgi:hypothetical protein
VGEEEDAVDADAEDADEDADRAIPAPEQLQQSTKDFAELWEITSSTTAKRRLLTRCEPHGKR